jgi:hypothetical protein
MAEIPDYEQKFEAAISDALAGTLVTRWVVVTELIEQDGERAIYVSSSDDSRTWDIIGMLDYALTRERAAAAYDLMSDADDS